MTESENYPNSDVPQGISTPLSRMLEKERIQKQQAKTIAEQQARIEELESQVDRLIEYWNRVASTNDAGAVV